MGVGCLGDKTLRLISAAATVALEVRSICQFLLSLLQIQLFELIYCGQIALGVVKGLGVIDLLGLILLVEPIEASVGRHPYVHQHGFLSAKRFGEVLVDAWIGRLVEQPNSRVNGSHIYDRHVIGAPVFYNPH